MNFIQSAFQRLLFIIIYLCLSDIFNLIYGHVACCLAAAAAKSAETNVGLSGRYDGVLCVCIAHASPALNGDQWKQLLHQIAVAAKSFLFVFFVCF